ncbi:MAG: DUF1569 domain-containing protein [Flavobacteriaceae bacterium]|nr:DUF1569 domain-containing protein [Flavobacteriaceae bacterium]
MKSLFEEDFIYEIEDRLEKLSSDKAALWGKMNAGQMVWHCQGPLNIMLQKEDYGIKPNWLAKVFFKKSLYNDRKWSKNLPTARFLKTKETKDFESEKQVLHSLIDEVKQQRTKQNWGSHPGFGHFTDQQWGQMQYKHLDHHLRQFGV